MVIHVIALKKYVVRLGNREITSLVQTAEKSVDDIKIC